MNHKIVRLLLPCLIIFTDCSKHPAGVEDALALAGDNRGELEKVLEHYAAGAYEVRGCAVPD